MRIAVTTSKGEKVDMHFGKAGTFSIYDVEGNQLKLVETREVESYCQCVDGEPVDPDHKFSPDRFSVVKDMIKDCEKLYTAKIGDAPRQQFEIVGMAVHTCTGPIEKIPGCSGNCK